MIDLFIILPVLRDFFDSPHFSDFSAFFRIFHDFSAFFRFFMIFRSIRANFLTVFVFL